jgi:hypothetical protein
MLMKFCAVVAGGALAAVLVTAATIGGAAAQTGSTRSTAVRRAEPFTPVTTMRIKPLESSKWTDAHREVVGPGGGLTQVQICLHNLELCRKLWSFTTQLTTHYTLPLRDKELLILRTAWLSRGNYVWGRHSTGAGKKAGITEEELTRITAGPEAAGWSVFDAALLRAADELHTSRFITDATWKMLAGRYSEAQLLEVIFVVGNYTMLTMYHNSVGLALEPTVKGLPNWPLE